MIPVTAERPVRQCVKCAGTDIGISFHKRGCSKEGCSCATCLYYQHAKVHEEHLHAFCRTCGFDWAEDTAEKLGGIA